MSVVVRAIAVACAVLVLGVLSACASTKSTGADRADTAPRPANMAPTTKVIATSRQGAAITAQTFAPAKARVGGARAGTAAGPVLIIACIHGDEREGLAAVDVVRTQAALAGGTVVLVENMNPDGAGVGRRGNARGVDLNRNWPTENFKPARAHGPSPLSEPESEGVHRLIVGTRPSLVIVLHSAGSGPFVNYDGPAAEQAARFAKAAHGVDPRWRVVAEMGYPTPGSLGTMAGDEMGIPILTIEFKRGQDGASVRAALAAGLKALL